MAFTVKHWVGVTLAGCALVAVLKLPPSGFEERTRRGTAPVFQEQVRFNALADEARSSRNLLRNIQWSDSLSAFLLETAEDGWALGIQGGDTLPSQGVGRVLSEFQRQLEQIPSHRPDVVLGAFLQSARLGDHPAAWHALTGSDFTNTTFFGRREGRIYCFNVAPTQSTPTRQALPLAFSIRSPDGVRRYDMLRTCRWIAALGLPGRQISRWLASGAHVLGLEAASPQASALSDADADPRMAFLRMQGRLRPLGFGLELTTLGACQAGREAACATVFADPQRAALSGFRYPRRWTEDAARTDEVTSPERAWLTSRGPLVWSRERWSFLFADLYRDFGPERMTAFWTSDEAPEVAFREAFGMEAGAWIASWVRTQPGYAAPGPLPRLRAVLWALAAVSALAGWAVVAGRRRTVAG